MKPYSQTFLSPVYLDLTLSDLSSAHEYGPRSNWREIVGEPVDQIAIHKSWIT